MSVLANAVSVVVPRESIERVWPGGVGSYAVDHASDGYCADEHLTRVGFTEEAPVRALLDRLQELGLTYCSMYEYLDVAVILQRTGTSAHCAWLSFANHQDGYSYCWLAGIEPGPLAAPPGWAPADSIAWDRETQGKSIRHTPVYVVIDPETGEKERDELGSVKGRGRPFEDTPMLVRSYDEEAHRLWAEGNHAGALGLWRAAIALAPERADLWFLGGMAARSSEGLEASLPFFERATELNPSVAVGWMDRGVTLVALRRPEEALPCLERALALEPGNAGALWNLGEAQEELGRGVEARRAFERFLEVAEADPELVDKIPMARERLRELDIADHLLQGESLERLGRFDDALGHYQSALNLASDEAELWFSAGAMLAKTGRADQALSYFDKCLELDTGHAWAWASKGAMLHEIGRPKDGLVSLERALTLDPNDAGAWWNKGAIEVELGRSAEAIRSYESFIAVADSSSSWKDHVAYARDQLRELGGGGA